MMNYAQWGNALYRGEKSYDVIGHRKVFVRIAAATVVVVIILVSLLGLQRSIEFTGGSQFTVVGVADADQQKAYDAVGTVTDSSTAHVSKLGSDSLRVQTESLDTGQTAEVRSALAEAYGVDEGEVQSSSIGPTWGQDVTQKAAQSLVIFLVIVTALMTVYFRSWTMSTAALLALFHDIAVTVGFFAITRVEISPATIIGFLTILGYSLYDTVVVFDKVRELTKGVWDQKRFTYGELVNLAVNQTMVRSINTSVVALLPVGSILFIASVMLGAGTLTDISLALFVGMIIGTYSSIFIASPLLVMLEGRRARSRAHDMAVLEARVAGSGTTDGPASGASSVRIAPVIAGHHLGQAAQPRRKNRRN